MDIKLAEILGAGGNGQPGLISILQKLQREAGYLSREAIFEIARYTGKSASEIFGVASFYAQFRFTPQGEHSVRVCMGTSCHVRGAAKILETVERELGIKAGEVTADRKFGLDQVACFGACALAPVMVVDKDVYGRMTGSRVKEILARYR
ncbi:MAG: NADH-quinone oxidoreductase subunit NuoE [Chloroflexota bacterium]|nr:NADH-quinone oxidoreductase subunit NuoE [Chloroflexota bacterium]